MTKAQKLFLFFLIAVVVLSMIQTSGVFRPWGVVPNFALAAFAVAAFFIESIISFLFLLVIGSAFLRFESGWSFTLLIFLLICLLLFWVRRRVLLPGITTTLVLIISGTLAFYLIEDFSLIYQAPKIAFLELLFNVIVGASLFLIANHIHAKGT